MNEDDQSFFIHIRRMDLNYLKHFSLTISFSSHFLNWNFQAYESGVDLIEFDLMLTKDDVVVVMHDDNLLRTCGEPELIASLTIDQIKKKNAGKTFYTSGFFNF